MKILWKKRSSGEAARRRDVATAGPPHRLAGRSQGSACGTDKAGSSFNRLHSCLAVTALGLASALLGLCWSAGPLAAQPEASFTTSNPALISPTAPAQPAAQPQPAAPAQSAPPAQPSVDHTMTLIKEVEVDGSEHLKAQVEQYQIQRGDSLYKIMKSRGLLTSRRDEPQMMRLIKSLNPELKNINALVPGQMLNLPAKPGTQAAQAAPAPEQTAGTAPSTAPPLPVMETVKVIHRTQPRQQPAVVTVMRQGEGQPQPEGPAAATQPTQVIPEAPPVQVAEGPTGPAGGSAPASAPAPAAAPDLDFPSGNPGALAMESDSRVVYRTVQVRKGDSLEKLLRREGLHRDLIYSHLLKVTLRLNPEIKNPNLIMVGAEIRIPAAGDYLTAMAGVDPKDVRAAAAAVAEGRRTAGAGAGATGSSERAGVLELPDEATETAKNTLALLFTRLGEKVDSQGQLLIPEGDGGVELDTAAFPLVALSGGGRVVLDPGSRMPREVMRKLRGLTPPYQIFRTGRGETVDRVLGRLFSMCGYFRVYTREQAYEGGGDILLKIAADWMVWPTQAAWNSGQPLVINRARALDRRTDPAWTRFLEDHGIKVMDIHRNLLLPGPEAPSGPPAELSVIDLSDPNPALMAAKLVRALGGEPREGVQLDLASRAGETVAPGLTAPVLWETGKAKVVLEFGELPAEARQTLRRNGYKVITSGKESPAVIDAVLKGFDLTARRNLVLTAPAGGPTMSLTITGRVVTAGGRKYLITPATLPSGLANLAEPGLKVLKY